MWKLKNELKDLCRIEVIFRFSDRNNENIKFFLSWRTQLSQNALKYFILKNANLEILKKNKI